MVLQLEKAIKVLAPYDALIVKDILQTQVPFDARALLHKRLQRWLLAEDHALPLATAVERAMQVTSHLSG